jgi:hypothetical protein
MNKNIFTIIAKSLICILVFVILLYLKNAYSYIFSSRTSGMIAVPKNGDLLFIGSSMTRQSYDTKLLNENLGLVYLVAYNGNQPCLILEEWRFLLARGVSWKKYYIEFYPQTSAVAPSISDLRIFLDSDLDLKLKYIRLLSLGRQLTFAEYYELFVTSNIELISTFLISKPLIDSLSYNGGYIGKMERGSDLESLDRESELIVLTTKEMDPNQKKCWADLFTFARSKSLEMEIWESPKYRAVGVHSHYTSIRNQMLEMTKRAGIPYRSLPFAVDDPSLFRDPIHLSTKGREIFTREVLKTF